MNTPPLARFEFATANRIIFGAGTLCELGLEAKALGHRALVVTGRNRDRAGPAFDLLARQGLTPVPFAIEGEPTTHQVRAGLALARAEQCDLIVAIGGGSALDAGKAIGGLLTNGGDLTDYLEVIGAAKPLTHPSAPVIVVPTTAGTGCEVTRNAVLASPEHRFKVSLRSPFLLPRLAIVDPELTYGLPPALIAATGLDALTQLIEPSVSARANPLTDALCAEGIRRSARSLRRACEHPEDAAVRADLALASLFSGLALANAGLGAVHGFAAPIGGMFPAPHGAVCAALLPHVMRMNVRALDARAAHHDARRRYDQVACWLTGRPDAHAADGIRWVSELCATLHIPPLSTYGLRQTDVPPLVQKASAASSMKGNPIVLTEQELTEVLMAAL